MSATRKPAPFHEYRDGAGPFQSGAPLQPTASPAKSGEVSHETFTNQRLFDLVRYKRSELHTDGLISDGEYWMLAQEHASVARLEDYDALKRKLANIDHLLDAMARRVVEEAANEAEGCQREFKWFKEEKRPPCRIYNDAVCEVADVIRKYFTPAKLAQLREAVQRG